MALLEHFDPISLAALNAKAALLERRDTKYVLNEEQLDALLRHTVAYFDVLTIANRHRFLYRSIYFDTSNYQTFKDHNQGKRNRIKVRRRVYLNSGLSYFEVKIKGLRDKTHKYRLPIASGSVNTPMLTAEEEAFLEEHYQKHYQRPWGLSLRHSITVDYERMTLVAKRGDERLTIDGDVTFFDEHTRRLLSAERWVLEVKSSSGRSPINKWLLRQGIRPVKRCSKYSMGMSLLKYPHNNRFRPVLKYQF